MVNSQRSWIAAQLFAWTVSDQKYKLHGVDLAKSDVE